jgi:hypothetical protein
MEALVSEYFENAFKIIDDFYDQNDVNKYIDELDDRCHLEAQNVCILSNTI